MNPKCMLATDRHQALEKSFPDTDRFRGVLWKSRIERHRMVNSALGDEVGGRIHALALATFAPGERIPA